LSTREIVLGKWFGTFRLVPAMAILPTFVVLCSDFHKWFYPATIFLTPAFVLVCGATVAGLGLAMATWCSRLGRAVALTVSVYVLVTVGWLFLGIMFQHGPGEEGLMMASPFFFAGELAADLCAPGQTHEHLGWALFWMTAYSLAALGLFVATLLTFNRCLGRIEFGLPRNRHPLARKPKPPRLGELAGEALEAVGTS
jgi:hypothetical protein